MGYGHLNYMKYAIGLDIGGTKIEGIIASDRGQIIKKIRRATESQKSRQKILNNIEAVIAELLVSGQTISSIGVCQPGLVIPQGLIKHAGNVPKLEGVNLKKHLSNKFHKKIVLANDAHCFTLAEAVFGAGRKYKKVVGIIWGTGLGGAIVIDKKIFSVSSEPGHTVLDPDAKVKCVSGHYGDLESFTSAPNLIKYYKLFGGKNKQADSTYIMNGSDKAARLAREQAIKYLSIALAFIINFLDPDIIILGGGISNSRHYKEINILVNKFVAPSFKNKCRVVKYKLSDSSGSLGSAYLALKAS